MSPFFQPYAQATTGATTTTVGLIYSALPFASFVCSFAVAGVVTRVGSRVALGGGLLLLAGSSLGFGLARSVPAWFLWRSIQGAATAPIYTSISCMLADTFTAEGEFA